MTEVHLPLVGEVPVSDADRLHAAAAPRLLDLVTQGAKALLEGGHEPRAGEIAPQAEERRP